MQIKDRFNRKIDYVRIAVTDRCNLRCFYCMPKEGIPYEPKSHLLSYEEITRLLNILGNLGFKKVRFTGGEPFLRKDFIQLLENTTALKQYENIHITTNGTLIKKQLEKLKSLGINNINLSLDSLDSSRFKQITRRNDFSEVMDAFHQLVELDFNVKVNAVIMYGINTIDILPLVKLAIDYPVNVRFIEEMPFNGGFKENKKIFKFNDIHQILKMEYPSLTIVKGSHGDTATQYEIDEFKGSVGIIPAFSRTLCDKCNRIRITADGKLLNCLYSNNEFDLKKLINEGINPKELAQKIRKVMYLKEKNGWIAQKNGKKTRESMTQIGG